MVVGSLVSLSQTAFNSGRYILDAPVISNEIIHSVKSERKGCVILKVDFEKAYDSVSWDFLDYMLGRFGFSRKWRMWISTCLSSSSMAVLINGSPPPQFSISRGLKQGDLMAPFLFILMAEGLASLVREARSKSLLERFKVGSNQVEITDLQFANDTIMVCSHSEKNLWCIKSILGCFEIISGLRVNFSKSSICGILVEDSFLVAVAEFLCCRTGNIPFFYFGIHVGANPCRSSSWNAVMDKVESKLASWKGNSRLRFISIAMVPIAILLMLFFANRIRRLNEIRRYKAILKEKFGNESTTLESLQFDFAAIEAATNKFSIDNLIGEGGFGKVYKGTLPNGQEVAVKRLSKSSGQGAAEFKNEVLLIAKLQHRNLVALLGFCLQEDEKILVYEFVPNKSLDYFLFDPEKQRLLSWCERYKIIGGIAQAIQYLHEYSRLKIIHRDIKPSNVLLDDKMSPKISDFGMARMVAIDQEQGRTTRVVGTYGYYMSPEYAMLGRFSEESDIFSFRVMVLEIISGKKHSTSYQPYYVDGLLSHAWKQWRDGAPFEILDPILHESCSQIEVMKCIQIGLLCVQEIPDDRPLMAEVVSYLSSPSVELPFPCEPAFFIHGAMEINMVEIDLELDHVSKNITPFSINEMSISESLPR